jgi:pimeloyl-ACP methyl ester carboxylesterase
VARDLPFLSAPLLVLWGERASATNPRSNADEFLRLTRNARLSTFAHSGLLPHEEEPEAVAAALEAFLPRIVTPSLSRGPPVAPRGGAPPQEKRHRA